MIVLEKQKLNSHKDLIVWQKSLDLIEAIYQITKTFPNDELYGLTSQMRRAVVSIATNITEGYQRNYIKEYIQFLYIAKSSASELETLLNIAYRLKLINSFDLNNINTSLLEILKMLSSLISKLKTKSMIRSTIP